MDVKKDTVQSVTNYVGKLHRELFGKGPSRILSRIGDEQDADGERA